MGKAVLAAAALAFAGCTPVAHGIPPKAASVADSRWQVVEIKGRATPPSDQYRMSFERGQLGARFGCNHMGGSYRQVGNVIHAGQVASTLMGCPEPAGTFEAEAGAILAQPMAISWISRDRLELTNRAGGMKLVRLP
ncbi:MAG TPA: META domain-containing protein [Sphingomicrobium sp.]|nr:META domain-containing protein [Sphingomicrobium sp.]